jgi:hypothetical protein
MLLFPEARGAGALSVAGPPGGVARPGGRASHFSPGWVGRLEWRSNRKMTGEDACPTAQNQRFTLDVGQASWPVGAFFSSPLD